MRNQATNRHLVRMCLLIFSLASFLQVYAVTTEKWGVFEVRLTGTSTGNPFTDVHLTAVFSHAGQQVTIPGFYDGNGRYVVRFSPEQEGKWTYRTLCNCAGLSGKTGSFRCIRPKLGNHGPVRVADTYHFRYADGKPYFSVGTTCYAWTSQPAALQEQTLNTLSKAPFNKMRMCVFPKWYIYNRTEPERFAFEHQTDTTFDFTRFDPVYWQNLEHRVAQLGEMGIEADLILFHPYDKWGFAAMDPASDERYLRYAMARLGAFRNIWWSLANEFDFMTIPVRENHNGNKHMEDWDRFFALFQKEDPYHRLLSIHNGKIWYDHTKDWVSHASIQNSNLEKGTELRKKYGKPVIYDECRYEGDIERGWGQLSGKTMTQRFWVGALNGCYVGHGETYRDPKDILWWAKGGVLKGESPSRIAFFRRFMEALPFHEMTPVHVDSLVFSLQKPGSVYLVYALKAGPVKLHLEGTSDYQVEKVDTWNMTVEKLKDVPSGDWSFQAPTDDCLLKLTAMGR